MGWVGFQTYVTARLASLKDTYVFFLRVHIPRATEQEPYTKTNAKQDTDKISGLTRLFKQGKGGMR